MLLAGAAAYAVLGIVATEQPTPQALASVPLFDDAGDKSMFPGNVLRPNVPVSRCLQ